MHPLNEVMKAINLINSSKSLRYTFTQFIIINPMVEINNFIQNDQTSFEEIGWILIKDRYKGIERGNGKCDNTLVMKQNDGE